jgi:hypothetical protein
MARANGAGSIRLTSQACNLLHANDTTISYVLAFFSNCTLFTHFVSIALGVQGDCPHTALVTEFPVQSALNRREMAVFYFRHV